jgi:hypothetical protein
VLTGGDTRVAVYGTVYATGQPAPAWTFTADAKATAALAGYANADSQVQIGAVYERPGSSAQIEAPSITTADPDMLIVCAVGEKSSAATSITEPEGTELRIAQLGFNTNAVPSALLCDFAQPVPGATGTRIATYNAMSNNGLGVQIGLRPRSA